MIEVNATTHEGRQGKAQLDKFPDKCPLCKTHGLAEFVVSRLVRMKTVYAVFGCPVDKCRALYIAQYTVFAEVGNNANYVRCSLQSVSTALFSENQTFASNIHAISPSFCAIYDQAHLAEANNLDQICGAGYRKALEFLIKDFLIQHTHKDNPAVQERVKSAFLGKVIEDFVEEERIKQMAKRAVWLGNDETHYVRKWESKDVSDLKSLIRITVNFVDLAIEADAHLRDMPGPK